MVTKFQEKPLLYSTLIQQFAVYVEQNWEYIVKLISERFPVERKSAEEFLYERRLIDAAAILSITCDILRNFLLYADPHNKQKIDATVEIMKNNVRSTLMNSEAMSTEDTTAQQIVRAISFLLLNGKICIAEKRPGTNEKLSEDGFSEKSFIFIRQERLYYEVRQYLFSVGIYFPLDMNDMAKILCEEGVAMSSKNGTSLNGTRKIIYHSRIKICGRMENFMKLDKQMIKKFEDIG